MHALIVRRLGQVDYASTYARMRDFTAARQESTPDELWLCEHAPVYTLGIAAAVEHLRATSGIAVVRTDRGGQVTYHGPGQVVAYPLLDLRRLGIYVKEVVYRLEQALLRTLEACDVTGHRVAGAPGIYVRSADPFGHGAIDPSSPAARQALQGTPAFTGLAKIAALGVKVSRHCTYHGVALNVAMDLRPFEDIDPCGHAGLAVTDLSTIGVTIPVDAVAEILATKLGAVLRA